MKRKTVLSSSALRGADANTISQINFADESKIPIRCITSQPGFHWFGYYDKWQFDPSDRYVLSNKITFEHRTPKASDEIVVGMVDLMDNDKWIELGKSGAWGWQQGCMLQWVPGRKREVIWNDRQQGRFVSHMLDIETGKKKLCLTRFTP